MTEVRDNTLKILENNSGRYSILILGITKDPFIIYLKRVFHQLIILNHKTSLQPTKNNIPAIAFLNNRVLYH
jgi:hypothetical protein